MDFKTIEKIICIMLLTSLLISANVTAIKITAETNKEKTKTMSDYLSKSIEDYHDFDPLSDINITVTIKSIRALDKIDLFLKPDFFIKIIVNDQIEESKVWKNTKFVKNANWSATFDVPDNKEFVNITIQLWDKNKVIDKKCDLNVLSKDIKLFYSLKTGHWFGDDYIDPTLAIIFDKSGYGRLNGCDDNSAYENDLDCEIIFDITQSDPDGDRIPYWSEVEIYNTDPEKDNTGLDCDNDGVPIEWEHKWGHNFGYDRNAKKYYHYWVFDPFTYENHSNMDLDSDGLDNIKEYLTSQWGSDPYRQDIFLEIDTMENCYTLTKESQNLITESFAKQNIVLHIDDGCMGGGGTIIPFKGKTDYSDLQSFYYKYFLNNNSNNWRRGVFHYGLMVNNSGIVGNAFHNSLNNIETVDSFQVSSNLWDSNHRGDYFYNAITRRTFSKERQRNIGLAGLTMHELGHTLGLFSSNVPGVDMGPMTIDGDRYDKIKLIDVILWYTLFGNYQSVMNYGYVYNYCVDYSDGSSGRYDNDDWDTIDLTFFQNDF